ncbi:hypothetical protein PRIPAC_85343 [Pristionchus pacificus]|uniref:Uncharacterized protein n=1 Tax=Pristionchus pacificus TaxID=54126 RepID=A0A2A6BSW3_PRIPA|nr:hypothetical protein PRIPAC_85343 [Pristionchus pacificus]|eukprot:PDM68994.1 hypothetical protein PRIPAC_47296 [Pristionchus pacificus]
MKIFIIFLFSSLLLSTARKAGKKFAERVFSSHILHTSAEDADDDEAVHEPECRKKCAHLKGEDDRQMDRYGSCVNKCISARAWAVLNQGRE